jgi:site-specific DNA-methyltransferase (adenine-specific)
LTWKLFEGDCLELMPSIPDKSVDMILADLPYGTTACKWDSIIPLEPLWEEYKRIIKDNGAIVLTASQPFTTKLISSNYEMFKYEWIWEKTRPSNIFQAKRQPLRVHENVLIFSKNPTNYNPQKWIISDYFRDKRKTFNDHKHPENGQFKGYVGKRKKDDGTRNPQTVISFNSEWNKGMHPTQKPVKLFEYLIKTYTNENDLILDNTAGSGTTGVACYNLNRDCIMIEKEPEYCNIIKKRMAELEAQPTLTAF